MNKLRSFPSSSLHDETTFYDVFIRDLLFCTREVIIESPFITSERMTLLTPVFERLLNRQVKIYVITRDPNEHSEPYRQQSESEIQKFEMMGVHTLLCTGNHHRKLAILDRRILYEGSLNILSQIKSREIMRRINSQEMTMEMFNFLKLRRFV